MSIISGERTSDDGGTVLRASVRIVAPAAMRQYIEAAEAEQMNVSGVVYELGEPQWKRALDDACAELDRGEGVYFGNDSEFLARLADDD